MSANAHNANGFTKSVAGCLSLLMQELEALWVLRFFDVR